MLSQHAVLGRLPCFVTELAGRRVGLEMAAQAMWERGSDGLPTGRRVPVLRPGDTMALPLEICA